MVLKHLKDRMRGYKEKQLNLNEFISFNNLDMILNNNFDLSEFELINYSELFFNIQKDIKKDLTSYIDSYPSYFDLIDLTDDDDLTDAVDDLTDDLTWEHATEVYQFFIISYHDAQDYWINYTDYPIFYNNELDLYLIGITHYGMSWDYFKTEFYIKEYFMD